MAQPAPNSSYNSFLIRFVLQEAESAAGWRAEIEHVQSGERVDFAEPDRMLRFLREHAGAIPPLLDPTGTLR